ncbi:hypothetical protein [Eubacterium sp.]|uniref:hypothetical protein n=1 Tax=Eubacterium sp. TaxID=142586 RepID=UPI0026E0DFF5|nr:hypothetical protein [Eubacterium sp.]MDO5432625.1 hypothetical protein [Eubacterium sp.]
MIEYGNASAAPFYPAPKVFIPPLGREDGGRIWSLGIDQELFIKGKPEVLAGGL